MLCSLERKKVATFTPKYHSEIAQLAKSLSPTSLAINAGLKFGKAFAVDLLNGIDPKFRKDVEQELEKQCYDQDTQVYLWDQKKEEIVRVAMKEVKPGDLLLTLQQQSDEFTCQFEPVVIVNRYEPTPHTVKSFLKIVTGEGEDTRELKLHKNHFMHVSRNGKHLCIEAKAVLYDDLLYAFDSHSEFSSLRNAKISHISVCEEGDITVPMNIRTPSLNLIVNDLWGSSKFNPDSGLVGHTLVCLAAKIHPQGGQKLQNFAHRWKLNRFLHS